MAELLSRARNMELRVRRAVEARREADPNPDDVFRCLYLTEEAVERLLDAPRAFPSPPQPLPPAPATSRLSSLARDFGLSSLDVDILLIALLPDLDDRFEAFYGYLNDDVTRRRPSVGLALGLCGPAARGPGGAGAPGRTGPLREGDLLLWEDRDRPFLGRALRVPDRVTAYLLGDDAPDLHLADARAPWQAVRGVGDPARWSVSSGSRPRWCTSRRTRAARVRPWRPQHRKRRAGRSWAWTSPGWRTTGAGGGGPLPAPRGAPDERGPSVRPGRVDAVAHEHPGLLRALTDLPLPVTLVGRLPRDAAWPTSPPLLLKGPKPTPEARAAL